MEDQVPPFVPPSAGGTPPAGPPVPPPLSPPAGPPVLAPPRGLPLPGDPPGYPLGGPPVGFAAPPARAPHPRRTLGIVSGIVVLSLLLVAGGVWGAVSIVQHLGHATSNFRNAGDGPPVAGAPQSPLARDPLNCAADCFADFIATATVPPPSATRKLGLTDQTDAYGDYASSDAGGEYDSTLDNWTKQQGTPATCFFTYFQSPVAETLGARPRDDVSTIDYTGTYTDSDKVDTLGQSIRMFQNSDQAVAYLAQLAHHVDACDSYRSGTGADRVTTAVTPAPQLERLPASVAAIGWDESWAGGRYYTIDLQRGNLVVRTYLDVEDAAITESRFRDFVSAEAQQLAALRTPGSTS
ncbi:hypothetical protein ACFPJ4_03660 [Lysinimonas soli]|uniref:PknH-like extracellular domain-containing protein n=1 Tax=Lysinimonas soli TaxID=1074233 RepID=A0ABW0NL84_9MICO